MWMRIASPTASQKDRNRIFTYALDFVSALVASWSYETLEAIFAVKLAFFLNETNVLQGSTTLRVDADKVFGAPDLAEGCDERSPGLKRKSYLKIRRLSIDYVPSMNSITYQKTCTNR